jgi:hypothetical protein
MNETIDTSITKPKLPGEIIESLIELWWHNSDWDSLKYVGAWQEASVWNLQKQWFTIRIPKDNSRENIRKLEQQRTNQLNFFYGMISWYASWMIPDYFRVPIVWNDPSVTTNLSPWIIVMQTVRWRTLLYYVMKKILKQRFWEAFQEDTFIAGKSDKEIVDNFFEGNMKTFIDMFALDKITELFWKEIGEKIQSSIDFLERKWLDHGDIHLQNIMVTEDDSWNICIYLIDFWKSTISLKSLPFIQNWRDYYLDKFSEIWNSSGIKPAQ